MAHFNLRQFSARLRAGGLTRIACIRVAARKRIMSNGAEVFGSVGSWRGSLPQPGLELFAGLSCANARARAYYKNCVTR